MQRTKTKRRMLYILGFDIYLDTDVPAHRYELTELRIIIPYREKNLAEYFDSFEFDDRYGVRCVRRVSINDAKNYLAKLEIYKTLKEKFRT